MAGATGLEPALGLLRDRQALETRLLLGTSSAQFLQPSIRINERDKDAGSHLEVCCKPFLNLVGVCSDGGHGVDVATSGSSGYAGLAVMSAATRVLRLS